MNQTADFAATHYGPRAQDYVASAVHGSGADLDQIAATLQGHADARVLDLGCGGGHVGYRVAPLVREVVACDPTASMLEAVHATATERGLRNIEVRQAAAERLPFADGEFDAVLSRFSTHHWRQRDAGLREARRVLKPGGLAIFVDVAAPEDALLDTHLQAIELLRDVSHVRNYRPSEWVTSLAAAGFAPAGLTLRRLPLRFDDWVARTRTDAAHVAAIRSLQQGAPDEVRAYFAMDADGSFTVDSLTLVAHAA